MNVTESENGFQTAYFSKNTDYAPTVNVIWCMEARTLNSKDKIFIKDDEAVKINTFVITSPAISF